MFMSTLGTSLYNQFTNLKGLSHTDLLNYRFIQVYLRLGRSVRTYVDDVDGSIQLSSDHILTSRYSDPKDYLGKIDGSK